jgi:hypothetical protein
MIHAGNLPVPDYVGSSEHATLSDVHECHTSSKAKSEKSQTVNHKAQHQCCLGVVTNLSANRIWLFDFSAHYGLEVPTYLYESVPSHIFKPPRKSST